MHASEVHGQMDMENPHGYHVIVASEPVSKLILLTKYSLNDGYFVAFVEGQWLLLKKGEFIMVGKKRINDTEGKVTNSVNNVSEEMEVAFDQLEL